MFNKIPGGTEHTLKYGYKVWIPPKPDNTLIHGFSKKTSDQIFERTKLPDFWPERREEEKFQRSVQEQMVIDGRLKKVSHFDPVLNQFRKREWSRRLNGFWFFLNGKATYLTGAHYYYLNWTRWDHKINDGYPVLYYNQIDRFYFRALCETDPVCMGYIILGPRGYGKCLGYNTPVLMYDGTIKMAQDIVDGDVVMGDDSTPRNVSGIVTGVDEMYRVIPKKGETWECNEPHILSLKWLSNIETDILGKRCRKGDVVNISVKDYENLQKRQKGNLFLYNKSGSVSGFDMVAIGRGRYYGFSLDGNHLFCLGDGTVTHNTTEEISCIVERITRWPRKQKSALQSKTEDDAKEVTPAPKVEHSHCNVLVGITWIIWPVIVSAHKPIGVPVLDGFIFIY